MFWIVVGVALVLFLAWMGWLDYRRRGSRRDVASGLRQGGLSQYGYFNPQGGGDIGGGAADGGGGH